MTDDLTPESEGEELSELSAGDAKRDGATAPETAAARLAAALEVGDASHRLQAALTAGTRPNDAYVDVLVARCAVEPDFFVREMLTWALIRHDPVVAVDRVVQELTSPIAQARSQALHTLSKIGDARAWPSITSELLHDESDEVARAAWRTSAGLVPSTTEDRAALAVELAAEFGRGDRALRRSLSRALGMLEDVAGPVVAAATRNADEGVRIHALTTAHLLENPDADFDDAVIEARRIVALEAMPGAVEDAGEPAASEESEERPDASA
ncbi:HEAT repeat domain-containing protein [Schumannella soli]|uniref:HEAT repeat domain-containing protein n=1 Tax=Schumannella soli TaxID=2590779 RepID=UPI002106BA77|nr:HEAT repeat domain-containing protein [Schumannella soli]